MKLKTLLIGNEDVQARRWQLVTSPGFTTGQVVGLVISMIMMVIIIAIPYSWFSFVLMFIMAGTAYAVYRFNL